MDNIKLKHLVQNHLRAVFTLAVLFSVFTANAQRIGLKTNALYWAAMSPNLGVELRVNRHLTFNFEGTDYTSSFSVFDGSDAIRQIQEETGVQIHGILSTDFLVKNKWIIDFDKLTIRTTD